MKNLLMKERSVALIILLTIITCGIYGLVVYFMFGYELRSDAKIEVDIDLMDPVLAFLLSIITCGVFGVVYMYFQSSALEAIGKKYNVKTVEPIIVLLLQLLVGIGSYFNYYSGNCIVRKVD